MGKNDPSPLEEYGDMEGDFRKANDQLFKKWGLHSYTVHFSYDRDGLKGIAVFSTSVSNLPPRGSAR